MRRRLDGGLVDRRQLLRFQWEGQRIQGYPGDTVASALLGAGIDVIGRSVAFDRPRGIMSAGAEEAHGFGQVGDGVSSEPLVRLATTPLVEGLVVESRATRGRLATPPERTRSDKRHAHCDLLVIGSGPAGLAAALTASRAGARVILAEQDFALGGALLRERVAIDGISGADWASRVAAELAAAPETRILRATTASIMLDGNAVVLIQRLRTAGVPAARADLPEQRVWFVRARQVVLATGALERPVVFADNDRPGIMLASGARAYLNRQAVAPNRGLVFTTTDDGYRTALDWAAAGVAVAGIVDPRPEPTGELPRRALARGLRVWAGTVVSGTDGDATGRLLAARLDGPAGSERVECDCLAVSGGYDPVLHLHLQLKGATRWDDRLHAAVPVGSRAGQWIVGAAAGRYDLAGCLETGAAAAGSALGVVAGPTPVVEAVSEADPAALWRVPAADGDESRSFIDGHRDVTVAGLDRAVGAGVRHIEHVKRFTLIGTGVEQGRAAKTNAGLLAAEAFGRPVADVGTSSARPPVEPMLFDAMAGRAFGERFEPVRTTALHDEHVALGAVFEPVGQWLRPRAYPRAGESIDAAAAREALAVRRAAGIVDVSTLGKIDVQGPDAATFLDRLYANPIASLPVGKARYGLLCAVDGMIFDDGVVMRLGPDRFFVTTSTGHAAAVFDWMEDWLQNEWPDLRVWVTSVTEQWSTVAIAGPHSREVVAALAPDLDCGREAFPFLGVRSTTVAGCADGLVARVSFSGELAWELSVPRSRAPALWHAALQAGAAYGLTPYGMEALYILRAEKGYLIVGQESDASTTPIDAGLGWMLGKKDFVGKRALQRADLVREDRRQLVGILPVDPNELVPDSAILVADPMEAKPMTALGHVTASHRSPVLERTFGLAMVRSGRSRFGQRLYAVWNGRAVAVTVCAPVMYDPEGARRDG
ncbi:MAG: 2Fe-2S iron-sulfur cluster-binding protein [Gemmatimonadales bacterium]|nr:2Fe-2S iron-sulfur cluster-binding protein [Gemmatimonadales bacterium]